MRLFHYRIPGNFHAYGPVRAEDEAAAKRNICKAWDKRSFPKRWEIWETSQAELDAIQENYRQTYHPMYAAE